MSYSTKEIQTIIQLIESTNSRDLLISIQLIKERGLHPSFVTEFYWMQHRLIWANLLSDPAETVDLFNKYANLSIKLEKIPLLNTFNTKEESPCPPTKTKGFLSYFELDCHKLAKYLFEYLNCEHYKGPYHQGDNFIRQFLIKYAEPNIQKYMLPYFIKKEHTGQRILDLGGLQLGHLTDSLLVAKEVHKIILWGNHLSKLPDIWHAFHQLETLNLNNNNLRQLPASFVQLKQLRKLYASGNQFEIATLVDQLKCMNELKYISISPQKLSKKEAAAQKSLLQYERLVNNGILNESPQRQKRYIALILEDIAVQKALSCQELVDALSDKNLQIAQKARYFLLKRQGSNLEVPLQYESHIAVLGILAYATRQLILRHQGKYHFSDAIQPFTNFIVLGDQIEQKAIKHQENYLYISEETLKKALQ